MNDDFFYLKRYAKENALVTKPVEGENSIVFLGDSITEFWIDELPSFFEGRSFLNRGISGQTTPQMLGRFEQDVISLDPTSLHLLAGTNDIAGNTGEMSLNETVENIRLMIQIAKTNTIQVYLGAVLPASIFQWRPSVRPLFQIIELNRQLQLLAEMEGIPFIDYHSVMRNEIGAMNHELTYDGVHPNLLGYKRMEDVFEQKLLFV
jgi:lysophospholipase L1-like esterase